MVLVYKDEFRKPAVKLSHDKLTKKARKIMPYTVKTRI